MTDFAIELIVITVKSIKMRLRTMPRGAEGAEGVAAKGVEAEGVGH